MSSVESISRAPSRNGTAVNGSELGVGCDSDDSDWFGSIARSLLGKDAGFALHLITGAPEGSCYKYTTRQAGSRRQPPGYLLRSILRSDQGWQFLAALMDSSDAPWWCELKRARRVAEAIARID